MTNEKYLDSIGIYQFDLRPKFLEVMESYGQNRWWLSESPCRRAYYQSEEAQCRILPLGRYHQDLEILLGRSISIGEIDRLSHAEIYDCYIASL